MDLRPLSGHSLSYTSGVPKLADRQNCLWGFSEMLSLSPEPPSQSIRTRPRGCLFNNLCVWGWYTACGNPGLRTFLLLKVWPEDQQHQHQPYYKCRFSGSTPDCLDLMRVQGAPASPPWTLHWSYRLLYCIALPSPPDSAQQLDWHS